MAISSDSLFHFTNKIEHLESILKGSFFPRYSMEYIPSINRETKDLKKINRAIPMICFCDIPLSQVKDHINFYGSYGIGLKKSWGRSVGLNPILYLDKDSNLSDHLVEMAYEIFKPELNDESIFRKLKDRYHDLVRYTKPYSGINKDRETNEDINNYVFYNEKEWRFVPKASSKPDENYLKLDQFEDTKFRLEKNREMEKNGINFKPSDVSYIIVKHEYETERIMNSIENLGHSVAETKKLIQKIQTNHQIMNDF